MPKEPARHENTYVIDANTGAETARLVDQDRFITENMGSLFPPGLDLAPIHDVLDVACGPGGWAREVAFHYPEMQVIGVDIDRPMIEYTQAYAQVQHLKNVQFHVMNALQPLSFPDATFDFINSRFLAGFMLKTMWPTLIQEFVRIARPGGIIRMTETGSGGRTSSPAFERFNTILGQVFSRQGRGFDTDASPSGATTFLQSLFSEAGLHHLQVREHTLDVSSGAPAHDTTYQNFRVAYKLIQPFLIKTGVVTQTEIEALYEQMLNEMASPQFQGDYYYTSVWGQKPL